jgi:hypothetical protein
MPNKAWVVIVLFLMLSGCATVPPPDNAHNICSIFRQYPDWQVATEQTERRWNVPVSVQMAIIYQESSFVSTAKPPRRRLLGFIPWKRPTTAYGYCQAVDPTWDLYQRTTGRYETNRYDFANAGEFIGWYAARANRRAGISPDNAYELYLAYHEGITNYMNKTYLRKPWLMRVAKKVQARAKMYQRQLSRCLMWD